MTKSEVRDLSEPVLARVAAGEASAMQACVARHGGLVWSLARRYARADAEDAVQEIFVDLWKSASRYDPEVASEAVFVAMIARRRLIDRRRRQDARPHTVAADVPAVPDDAAGPDRCAEASLAKKALDKLRPEQRQVLLLATAQGLSHGEIAEETGLPLGTVKSHVRRALGVIRAALLGVEETEETS